MDKIFSYLYGFLQADGNLYEQSRNRGKVSIEILKKDEDILLLFNDYLTETNTYISYRNRQTNFGYGEFVKLGIYDINFRNKIKSFGFPVGKKDEIIEPPICESYYKIDYIRGLIDGDGSLGLTGNGFPFLSLITKSDKIKDFYIDFIFEVTGKRKVLNRNKRGNAYNIGVYKEDAQKIVEIMYYDECICLKRKMNKSKEVLSWVRPPNMRKRVTNN